MKAFAKYFFFCIAFVGVRGGLFSQNIVNNYGFETYSTCPSTYGQLSNATGWTNVSNHTGTPDYFNGCGGSGTTNTSNNYFGSEAPFAGSAYSGLCTYHQSVGSFREYLQSQLAAPLTAGNTYTVKFQVSVADYSNFTSDGIQAHLRSTPGSGTNSWTPLPYTPQITQPTGSCIGSKNGWTEFTGNFVASGGEQYIIVGNFDTDASTSICAVAGGNTNIAYYYLDEVTVQPASALAAQLIDYSGSRGEESSRIYWKTTNEQQVVNYIIERSTDLIHFEEIGQVTALGSGLEIADYEFTDEFAPNEEVLYYRLVSLNQAGQNGFAKTLNLRHQNIKTNPEIFPNPSAPNQNPVLSWHSENEEMIRVVVTDLSGRELLNEMVAGEEGRNEVSLNRAGLTPGVYVVNLKGISFSFSDRLVIR